MKITYKTKFAKDHQNLISQWQDLLFHMASMDSSIDQAVGVENPGNTQCTACKRPCIYIYTYEITDNSCINYYF